MDGGGFEPTSESQALYQGELRGLEYPVEGSRLRYFGGASNHWAGYTRPLDVRDFEPLPHHPMNEWPIRKRDLDVYAPEAADILDLPDMSSVYDIFKNAEIELSPIGYRMSPPTRFGTKYREEIVKERLIWLCLNANLIDIELENDLRAVSAFVFRIDDRTEPCKVRARNFAICCGGMENARILLVADRQVPHGIGNQNGLVGRCFCEHIDVLVGRAVMASRRTEECYYLASDDLMKRHRCLSFIVGLGRTSGEVDRTICALPFPERLGRAVLGRSPVCHDIDVGVIVQQACNLDSRVTLSDKKDRFGLRRLSLDWRLTELDHHTIRTAALEVGRALAQNDAGRMQLAPFLARSEELPGDRVQGQNHHMCTTRMSESPSAGVVDGNCRVHGVGNLYIGGSSVFASAGVSNPTYTIVQLALRLADHLNEQL
jgi:hypothetical protein